MGEKAVTEQPNGDPFPLMPLPFGITNCPPGLEYIAAVDQLIFKQEVSIFEALTGFEVKNKYRVFNSINQQAYWVLEESDTCNRIWAGPQRGFVFHVTDNNQQDVMTIERPFLNCKGCCWCADGCCKYPIYVKDKTGRKLGMIRMMNSCCKLHFGVYDENEVMLYEIWSPCCPCTCGSDIDFPIRSVKDNEVVGNVAKTWTGTLKEFLTDADTYCLTFPMNLDVVHKALMFACVFQIDFAVFETQKNQY